MVVSDGVSRLVNQNDCRTTDLAALRDHGPVDLHWLQYSGAIWYPMVYDMPDERKRALVRGQGREPVRAGDALRRGDRRPRRRPQRRPARLPRRRALAPEHDPRRRAVDLPGPAGVPGPPGRRPATAASSPSLAPSIEIRPDGFDVVHPIADADVQAIFDDKESYLRHYQEDWKQWLRRPQGDMDTAHHRSRRHAPRLVGAAAAHGADAVLGGRRQLPVPGRRARTRDRLPQRRGAPVRR